MQPDRRSTFAADLTTVPNLMTLSRILLVPVAAALFFAGYTGWGIIVALVAGMTDYADGYLARRLGQVTRLGEILDQFCDIYFESLVITVAAAAYHFVPLWFITLYLGREFWVTSIRRYMAGHQLNIASNFTGKLKTNFLLWGSFPTFLSLGGFLPALEPALGAVGKAGFAVGIFFGYASAWEYTRQLSAGYNRIASARAAGTAGVGDGTR